MLYLLKWLVPSIQAIEIPDNSLQQILFFSIHGIFEWLSSLLDCIQLFELQIGKFALSSLCSFTLMSKKQEELNNTLDLPQLRTIDLGFNSLSTGQCAFPFCSL